MDIDEICGLAARLNGDDATLATIFPDKVFAHWDSGTIRIPRGKMLEYGHMGYGST
ncbi:MAG: hypothetical protein ACRESZ_23055 [Methylococcales bacterium]